MKFLRLPDPLLTTLFQNEDIIAIDKPYGFNAHTNDSKVEYDDLISEGLIEIYEKHLNQKLHVIHRLDQTTTGVMIFGKSSESAKKYAEYFFNREVKKTYRFITKAKSKADRFSIDSKIIHKAKELEAQTDLNLIKRSQTFELWEALPHTGRNHQIRIHAKAAGIPIFGDLTYGGHPNEFLCLHNCQIEFPNGIVLKSKPPVHFENLEILNNILLSRALFEIDRRSRLFAFDSKSQQCFRMIHNKLSHGISLDHFGEISVVNWYRESFSEADKNAIQDLASYLKTKIVLRQNGIQILSPEIESWKAFENNRALEFKALESKSNSFSQSQRLQRIWVQANSNEKSVLNLFSATNGFSVAAAMGKASSVTSVDSNKASLFTAQGNFDLNKLDKKNHKFLLRDSCIFLDQCKNKNTKFDLIICDAPTFLRREKGIFKIEKDFSELLKKCLTILNSQGTLLFSTQSLDLTVDEIRREILKIQKEMGLSNLEINRVLPSMDFELPSEKTVLKSFLLRL